MVVSIVMIWGCPRVRKPPNSSEMFELVEVVKWCSTIPCDSQPRWEFPGGLFPSRPQDIMLRKPTDRHGLIVGCQRSLGVWGICKGSGVHASGVDSPAGQLLEQQ